MDSKTRPEVHPFIKMDPVTHQVPKWGRAKKVKKTRVKKAEEKA